MPSMPHNTPAQLIFELEDCAATFQPASANAWASRCNSAVEPYVRSSIGALMPAPESDFECGSGRAGRIERLLRADAYERPRYEHRPAFENHAELKKFLIHLFVTRGLA